MTARIYWTGNGQAMLSDRERSAIEAQDHACEETHAGLVEYVDPGLIMLGDFLLGVIADDPGEPPAPVDAIDHIAELRAQLQASSETIDRVMKQRDEAIADRDQLRSDLATLAIRITAADHEPSVSTTTPAKEG